MTIPLSNYQNKLTTQTLTIPSGQTVSNSLNCQGAAVVGIYLPANFTVADLSFYASQSGAPGDFWQVANPDGSGNNVALAANASSYLPIDPTLSAGIQWLQIASSVAQTANCNLTVVLAPILQ